MNHLTENTAVTDTTALRATIEIRATAFFKAVSSGATLAQQLALLPVIMRLYRLLLTIEGRNRVITLKRAMLSNPVWRGRVYAELGGWWGAKRWQDRMAVSQRPRKNKPLKSRITSSPIHGRTQPAQAQSCRRFKTDSLGQFRWAAIPRGNSLPPHTQKQSHAVSTIARPPSASSPHPIPLTPQDFVQSDKANPTASDISMQTTPYDDPIETLRETPSQSDSEKAIPPQGPAPPY